MWTLQNEPVRSMEQIIECIYNTCPGVVEINISEIQFDIRGPGFFGIVENPEIHVALCALSVVARRVLSVSTPMELYTHIKSLSEDEVFLSPTPHPLPPLSLSLSLFLSPPPSLSY
jgi:hypothetical protein